MPNHCDNNMYVKGDNAMLSRFWNDIQSADKDGNRIVKIASLVPMPDALEGTQSPTPSSPEPHPNWKVMLDDGKMTQEWYDHLVKDTVEKYEAGQKAIAETGYSNWYDWANSNWGTKWGDYDTALTNAPIGSATPSGELEFFYQTAWSPFSNGFLKKISEMYPTLTFSVAYSELGMGYVGYVVVMDGDVMFDESEEPSPSGDIDLDDDEGYEKFYDSFTDALDAMKERAKEIV